MVILSDYLHFWVAVGWFCACADDRRLVLHSDLDISQVIDELRKEINATKQENTALKAQMAQENSALKTQMTQENAALKTQMLQEMSSLKAGYSRENSILKTEINAFRNAQGSTYIRWGRTVCEGNGTEKVYSGYTAGSPYDITGGPSSFICLPEQPTWAHYIDGLQNNGGYVFGTEYQTDEGNTLGQIAFGKRLLDEDAPCAVCRSPRTTTIMVPGRTSCHSGWTMEYTGYLMTGHHGHTGATDYACLDLHPEAVFHGESDQNGRLFYFTEVVCGSLPCQEYPQGRELACVVCSK